MNISEYIFSAVRCLSASKMRTFLTTLGIIVGISSVILINTLGESLSKTIENVIYSLLSGNEVYIRIVPSEDNTDVEYDEYGYPIYDRDVYFDQQTIEEYDKMYEGQIERVLDFYEYSINDKTNTFIAEGDYNNTILMNINNLYLYNDNNKLYSYDGVSNNEIYEAESKISEISYLNPNEIIIIPDTYTNDDCSLASVKAGILNIQTKKISIKTINGCLDTKIINDVIFAK